MKQNVFNLERITRLFLSIVCIPLALNFGIWWLLPAGLLYVSALVGWCPGHAILHMHHHETIGKPRARYPGRYTVMDE